MPVISDDLSFIECLKKLRDTGKLFIQIEKSNQVRNVVLKQISLNAKLKFISIV